MGGGESVWGGLCLLKDTRTSVSSLLTHVPNSSVKEILSNNFGRIRIFDFWPKTKYEYNTKIEYCNSMTEKGLLYKELECEIMFTLELDIFTVKLE